MAKTELDTRGTVTPNGVYLGTSWVERPTRLTREQAEEHTDAYLALGHEVYVEEQFRENIVNKLQDFAIAFTYTKTPPTIEVPAQEIDGFTVPGFTFTPEPERIHVLAEDFYLTL